MLTMGDVRRTHLTAYGPDGVAAECVTYDQHLFHDAYVVTLAEPPSRRVAVTSLRV